MCSTSIHIFHIHHQAKRSPAPQQRWPLPASPANVLVAVLRSALLLPQQPSTTPTLLPPVPFPFSAPFSPSPSSHSLSTSLLHLRFTLLPILPSTSPFPLPPLPHPLCALHLQGCLCCNTKHRPDSFLEPALQTLLLAGPPVSSPVSPHALLLLHSLPSPLTRLLPYSSSSVPHTSSLFSCLFSFTFLHSPPSSFPRPLH